MNKCQIFVIDHLYHLVPLFSFVILTLSSSSTHFHVLLYPTRISSRWLGTILSNPAFCFHSLNILFDPVSAAVPNSFLLSPPVSSLSCLFLLFCLLPESFLHFYWIIFNHLSFRNIAAIQTHQEVFPQHLGSLQLRIWPHVFQAATHRFKMHFLITSDYTLLSVGKVWILISCGKKHDLFPTLEEPDGTELRWS